MIWEQRQVLENVKKRLRQQESLPEENGELDFHFLSALERMEEGKLSVLCKKLMAFFAEDTETGDPASALEDMASMLLLWSANIRSKQQNVLPINFSHAIGTRLQVRLPDHFPLFIVEVIRKDTVFVPALQKEYCLEEVQIIPEQKAEEHQTEAPVILQKELFKNLRDIQENAQQRIIAFQRSK